MKVSILITTFNRPELLRRAIQSVVKQDYQDWELVVIDDASEVSPEPIIDEFGDSRILFIRNPVNVGAIGGDLAILREFVAKHCRGDAFVYLCDDDYWIPDDLLARQVQALNEHPSLAFVQGGMAQCYPTKIMEFVPNADYISPVLLDATGECRQMFGQGLFPSGVMTSKDYLRLYAADPKNRNIVTGATLYRTATFKAAGALDRAKGVRWQAGYVMSAGVATMGDVLYLDEPCVMTAVDVGSASFRGTQRTHMMDALCSVDAAFAAVAQDDPEYRAIRDQMARSVLMIYVLNKMGHALGWFASNLLGDISHHFVPPIPADEFLQIARDREIPLNESHQRIIRMSDGHLQKEQWPYILEMAA